MIETLDCQPARPGNTTFRVQAGLTVATLAHPTHPAAADRILRRTAEEALEVADGYAVRDILRHHNAAPFLTGAQQRTTKTILDASGLAAGYLPEPLHSVLVASARSAAASVQTRWTWPACGAGDLPGSVPPSTRGPR